MECHEAIFALVRMPRKNKYDYEKLDVLRERQVGLEHELQDCVDQQMDELERDDYDRLHEEDQ